MLLCPLHGRCTGVAVVMCKPRAGAEDASGGEESDADERSDEEAEEASSDGGSGADEPGAHAPPRGLPGHVAVAAGGRVRRRAVFPDGAAAAGAPVSDDADSDDDGEAGEAYENLAALRSGAVVGPSGRGLDDSGSEDSEGALLMKAASPQACPLGTVPAGQACARLAVAYLLFGSLRHQGAACPVRADCWGPCHRLLWCRAVRGVAGSAHECASRPCVIGPAKAGSCAQAWARLPGGRRACGSARRRCSARAAATWPLTSMASSPTPRPRCAALARRPCQALHLCASCWCVLVACCVPAGTC